MARYENTNINYSGKVKRDRFRTTIYSEVPLRNDDMYFIAQEGDRCDLLANRFYNNIQLWWFIARVNNLTTMNIPAGTKLRIPITAKDATGR